jgi:hypothetical protein
MPDFITKAYAFVAKAIAFVVEAYAAGRGAIAFPANAYAFGADATPSLAGAYAVGVEASPSVARAYASGADASAIDANAIASTASAMAALAKAIADAPNAIASLAKRPAFAPPPFWEAGHSCPASLPVSSSRFPLKTVPFDAGNGSNGICRLIDGSQRRPARTDSMRRSSGRAPKNETLPSPLGKTPHRDGFRLRMRFITASPVYGGDPLLVPRVLFAPGPELLPR